MAYVSILLNMVGKKEVMKLTILLSRPKEKDVTHESIRHCHRRYSSLKQELIQIQRHAEKFDFYVKLGASASRVLFAADLPKRNAKSFLWRSDKSG